MKEQEINHSGVKPAEIQTKPKVTILPPSRRQIEAAQEFSDKIWQTQRPQAEISSHTFIQFEGMGSIPIPIGGVVPKRRTHWRD